MSLFFRKKNLHIALDSVRLGIDCWKSLRSSFIASQEIVQMT